MNIDHHRRESASRADEDEPEHEISLGTATIFGLFLALALVCAAFFGFGYSMGHHAAPPAIAAASEPKPDASPAATPESPFKNFKSGTAAAKTDDSEADAADTPAPKPVARKVAEVAPPRAAPAPAPVRPTASSPDPVVVATGQFVVQISAPSRQGDADALLSALSRKGYKAYIRKEPQDSFLHVQVGPYATKSEAQAMAKRLDADGYKPFVK